MTNDIKLEYIQERPLWRRTLMGIIFGFMTFYSLYEVYESYLSSSYYSMILIFIGAIILGIITFSSIKNSETTETIMIKSYSILSDIPKKKKKEFKPSTVVDANFIARQKTEINTGKCEKCGRDLVMDNGGNWTCYCDAPVDERPSDWSKEEVKDEGLV